MDPAVTQYSTVAHNAATQGNDTGSLHPFAFSRFSDERDITILSCICSYAVGWQADSYFSEKKICFFFKKKSFKTRIGKMLLQNALEHRKIFCRIGTNVLTPVFLHTKVMLTLSIIIPL